MSWLPWVGRKKQVKRKGLIGVNVSPKGIAMAYLGSGNEGNGIPKIEAYSYVPTEEFLPALRRFVFENDLEGVACNYVLPGPDYTLTLIDTPNVAPNEVKRAMQWLVREMINFPIEEAAMDSFAVPIPRARDNAKLSYVTVIRRTVIPAIEALIKPTGLSLQYVDIPELALRNLVSRYPEEVRGLAFIQLYPLGGRLIICKGGNVFSARFFDIRLDILQNPPAGTDVAPILEQLALEVQRSLDYFTSTFRQVLVSSLLLAPSVFDNEMIKQALQNALGTKTNCLDLNEILRFETPMSKEDQTRCLLAIGGALRDQENTT